MEPPMGGFVIHLPENLELDVTVTGFEIDFFRQFACAWERKEIAQELLEEQRKTVGEKVHQGLLTEEAAASHLRQYEEGVTLAEQDVEECLASVRARDGVSYYARILFVESPRHVRAAAELRDTWMWSIEALHCVDCTPEIKVACKEHDFDLDTIMEFDVRMFQHFVRKWEVKESMQERLEEQKRIVGARVSQGLLTEVAAAYHLIPYEQDAHCAELGVEDHVADFRAVDEVSYSTQLLFIESPIHVRAAAELRDKWMCIIDELYCVVDVTPEIEAACEEHCFTLVRC